MRTRAGHALSDARRAPPTFPRRGRRGATAQVHRARAAARAGDSGVRLRPGRGRLLRERAVLMENPFEVLSHVTRALEEQGVAYVVVGSFASSMRGLYRATADIDLVADLQTAHVRPLVEALQDKFYIDEQAVRRAVSRRSSFN